MSHYLIVEGGNVFVDRESRVIQRLVAGADLKAYQLDISVDPPKLSEAVLGNREDVVARVVVKDLEVDGKKVGEAQVQVVEKSSVEAESA